MPASMPFAISSGDSCANDILNILYVNKLLYDIFIYVCNISIASYLRLNIKNNQLSYIYIYLWVPTKHTHIIHTNHSLLKF
jgi:hypothetical protein